ncbi:TAXI family TRAP transporter solute-binding subunit [Brevibacterium renqingii]|uniref:TAXI family TRAP transporter solute-binding subunit n=1 Tax=Brevibacterium renqingii TaxID=2776916 RepID=UPI001AE0240F|nr:TAXI family TRAP transporter solute-binding subunit [Brevibacterium renqingii]
MRTSRRFSLFATTASAAAFVLLATACGGGGGGGGEEGEASADFITIATGGSSGVYYQVGATMSEILADDLGADTSVQSTGASVENLTLIEDGGAELAFTQGDAVDQALNGEGPFDGKEIESLPVVANLYDQYVQLVTVERSGIESIEDIKGKAVSVGDQNSGVELNAKTVVDAYGLSYDDFDADYLPYAEAIDQMRNGQLDAAFVTSGLPNSAVTDLATSDKVKVVPFTGEGREKLLAEHDYFGEGEVPAGTYGDSEAAETLTIPNLLVVSPSLSDDAVYDVTKSLFDNLDQIQSSHNAAKDITVDTAQDVPVGEVAPGAKKYFDEQG